MVEKFFKDLKFNLYRQVGGDFFPFDLRGLESLVMSSDDSFQLLVEEIDFAEMEVGYVSPSFDKNGYTYLLKEVRWSNNQFLIDCEIIGSDFTENEEEKTYSIENLRKIFQMDTWFFSPRSFFVKLGELFSK